MPCQKHVLGRLIIFLVQHRPSSHYNALFWTTNSGAPVWNNNSSLTVGIRGNGRSANIASFERFITLVDLLLLSVFLLYRLFISVIRQICPF